jgi:carboxylesterase
MTAAALVLHGFTGDPWEVRPLADALAARGYRVETPRLPGHDGRPESLERATLADWRAATREAFERLAARDRPVCVAGLSLGALLALDLAAETGRVAALATLATPLRLIGSARTKTWLLTRLGVRDRWRFVPKGPRDVADQASVAESPHTPILPARAVLEVERLRRLARGALTRITAPTLVVHGRQDHTAWPGSVAWLKKDLRGPVEILWLSRSYHLVTVDVEKATVAEAVCGFFGRHAGVRP